MDFHELFERTTLAALNRLQQPHWVAKDFCHYTSLQGLVGIVASNEVWLSDHRFVNDPLEYEYGKQLALNTIKDAVSAEMSAEFRRFLDALISSLSESSGMGIYIGSMSFSADKLDQWKGYGNASESICIKFAGDYGLWNTGNSHPTHLRQQKIIYDKELQVRLIQAIIRVFKRNFDDFRSVTYPFLKDLTWLIESQFILFKHPEYKSEDELRLTIANLDHILANKKPKHRITKGMVVPYITTKYISRDPSPPLNRLPIKEIVVSPTSHRDLLESVKVFIANMGYTDVPVVGSSIKFRG